jgi:hypothetical protein
VREVNPETRCDHFPIHCEAIVANTLPGVLKNMLAEVVKSVNFFKWQPNKFMDCSILCQEVSSESISLFLLTEVQRMSCGKVLSRAFELGDQVQAFVTLQERGYTTG